MRNGAESMVSLHSKLHIVCEECTQRHDANFLFIVFTCGKENITRHKNLEFSRHFFSVKMLPFYICDCCHMRGKFQMPVNYLFVCLFWVKTGFIFFFLIPEAIFVQFTKPFRNGAYLKITASNSVACLFVAFYIDHLQERWAQRASILRHLRQNHLKIVTTSKERNHLQVQERKTKCLYTWKLKEQ